MIFHCMYNVVSNNNSIRPEIYGSKINELSLRVEESVVG